MKRATETPAPALLLIADISGFTRFMRLHALATSHARQIIARLLKALIDAAQPPLKVAELEGDAVFFYALATDGDLAHTADRVKPQILRFIQVFKREVEALERMPACVCEACMHVGQLRLKQVVHGGEVSVTQIDRFEKLFGLDVIVVHRMLKNSVPSNEYVMMTESAFASCTDFFSLDPERRVELFDGIGEVPALVFYEAALAAVLKDFDEASARSSRTTVLVWKLNMHARTLLQLLGVRPREATKIPAIKISLL